MIIFGTNVTKKVVIQNILYFPTSPNLCFCTTWGNRKQKLRLFTEMLHAFYQKQHETDYHLVTAEPPFTVKMIDWMHQTVPKILLPTVCVNQDCHSVGRCVKDWSCSSSSLSESQRTVLMGYLTISTNVHAIKHSTDDNFYRVMQLC